MPSFLQNVSCLLDVRAEPDVASLTKNTLRHAARGHRHPWYRRDHESIELFSGHLQTVRSSHIGMDGAAVSIGRLLC